MEEGPAEIYFRGSFCEEKVRRKALAGFSGKAENMTNHTMFQYFEWYLPENGLHWRRCAAWAKRLKESGVDMVWLPPAYKGAAGAKSVGYDVYDTYDLGEFDQKGSVRTKYGTREEYLAAVRTFQAQGIQVLADIVLNHKMGADGTETVVADETLSTDRNKEISPDRTITAWTRFDFPGRAGKYSAFQWRARHFSGTDWDEGAKRKGIFRFDGKNWERKIDDENGNYDYLMGADLDTDQPEVVQETAAWGRWYLDTVHMDGFRLDAVKHIGFDFYRNWLKAMREHAGRELFAVGEYWSKDVNKLKYYLDTLEGSLSLFDVPLHFHFLEAATSNGNYDMSRLFENTLTGLDPACAVPFVDNHDTQPGQALASFIPAWFKPLAYALILLRDAGIPCVFYGDYYGIPHDRIAPVPGLGTLMKARELYAYGKENLYFDDPSVVGFTREGDGEHPDSGAAVLLTDSVAGRKRMYVGRQHAGKLMRDVRGEIPEAVAVGSDGWAEFSVGGGSVSVWLFEKAAERLYIEG